MAKSKFTYDLSFEKQDQPERSPKLATSGKAFTYDLKYEKQAEPPKEIPVPPSKSAPEFVTNEVVSTAPRLPMNDEALKLGEKYLSTQPQGQSIMENIMPNPAAVHLTPQRTLQEATPLYQQLSQAFPGVSGVAAGIGRLGGGQNFSDKLQGLLGIGMSTMPEAVAFNTAMQGLEKISPKSATIVNKIMNAPSTVTEALTKKDLDQTQRDILAIPNLLWQGVLFAGLHEAIGKTFGKGGTQNAIQEQGTNESGVRGIPGAGNEKESPQMGGGNTKSEAVTGAQAQVGSTKATAQTPQTAPVNAENVRGNAAGIIPEFKNTQEALAFGKSATPDQLKTLRDRLTQKDNATNDAMANYLKDKSKENANRVSQLATQAQLDREAVNTKPTTNQGGQTPPSPAPGMVTLPEVEQRIKDSGALRSEITPGLSAFITSDVIETAKKVPGGVRGVYEAAKRDFQNLFAPETISDASRKADAIVAKNIQDKEQLKQALQKQTRNQFLFWESVPEEMRLHAMDALETGAEPSFGKFNSQVKDLFTQYRQRFDKDFENEKGMGIHINYVSNYFPHMWENPEAAQQFFREYAQSLGKDKYAKERTIDLIKQGISAGLKLKTTNLEEVALKRDFDSARMLAHQQTINDLESMGLARQYDPSARVPGEMVVDAPNGKRYSVPPDVARVLQNALFSPSLWSNKGTVGVGFRGLMALKNMFVPIKLGLSLFHPVHIIGIDNAARAAVTIEKVADKTITWDQGVKEGVNSFIHWTRPKGSQFLDAYDRYRVNDADMPDAMKQSVNNMIEGGFNPRREGVWKTRATDSFKKALADGNYPGAVIRGVPALLQAMQTPIFDKWIPALRAAQFDFRAKALFEGHPELLDKPAERAVELRKIGKEVDNQYGEMNYSTLFWNRWLRDVGVGTSLSLGWNLGFLREFGGAAIDFAKAGKDLFAGNLSRADLTNKMLFTTIYTAEAMGLGGLMTWAMTGKPPTQMLDYFYPRTGAKNDDGSDERLSTPYYTREYFMATDHIAKEGLVGGLTQLGVNKSNPVINPLIELWQNKDFYGYQINDPNAPALQRAYQIAGYIGKQLLPISIGSGLQSHASEKARIASFAGFNPAPRYITRTGMQSKIMNLYEERFGGGTKPYSQKQAADARRNILNLVRGGNAQEADQAIQNAVQAGILTTRQVQNIRRSDNEPTDVFMYKRLPKSDKIALWDEMSEEEKKRYPNPTQLTSNRRSVIRARVKR